MNRGNYLMFDERNTRSQARSRPKVIKSGSKNYIEAATGQSLGNIHSSVHFIITIVLHSISDTCLSPRCLHLCHHGSSKMIPIFAMQKCSHVQIERLLS